MGTLLAAFILESCRGDIWVAARNDDGVLRFWQFLGFEVKKNIFCFSYE